MRYQLEGRSGLSFVLVHTSSLRHAHETGLALAALAELPGAGIASHSSHFLMNSLTDSPVFSTKD